jgi:hypothetical protein
MTGKATIETKGGPNQAPIGGIVGQKLPVMGLQTVHRCYPCDQQFGTALWLAACSLFCCSDQRFGADHADRITRMQLIG